MFGRVSWRGAVSIGAAVLATALVSAAPAAADPLPQSLNQARPQGSSCHSVGGGMICRDNSIFSYGPVDTGIVCGSGASAFDIFDQGTLDNSHMAVFDENGNLTKLTDNVKYSFGQWSNPLTGDVVSYTQHNTQTYDLAVPGDFTSATFTITGENVYRSSTGQTVLLSAGRSVFNFDQSQLLSSHGPNAFVAAFFEGDPHAFDLVCAALSAT